MPIAKFPLLVAGILLLGLARPVQSTEPISKRLVAYPERIELGSKYDSQLVVAMTRMEDGCTQDVSTTANYRIAEPSIARVQDGILVPTGEGKTELIIEYEGQSTSVPVVVTNAKAKRELTFRNDVLPVLTRVGCNTGRCHGQAAGKDGFLLSLYGYDPKGDYHRITRELAGRRINLSTPSDCLLINKATGAVQHTGGQLVEVGSREYRVLYDWLNNGAVPDPKEMPLPVKIEVLPEDVVFDTPGNAQSLVVMAHYDNGTSRDVTEDAVFISNNDGAASVTPTGMVSSVGPGTAFIMARYDQFTAGSSVTVWPKGEFQFPSLEPNNYIDELAFEHWQRLHVSPSPLASDEEFVRRVYVDLLGLLPTVDEQTEFLESTAESKREVLVDKLLERDEFRDLWVMKWAEALQIRTINGISDKGLELYDAWLRNKISSGATVAEVLHEVIPASGGTFDNPATNYYQTETTPQLLAEGVAQSFLGMRIQCAQCHNHPFDRWTMDDYYGFAAFFGQVGYKITSDPRELAIYNSEQGDTLHPVSDQAVAPKFLGAEMPEIKPGEDYRAVLADWITSTQNRSFARNIGNLVWAHMFGIGIVEPYDDARVSNPPSNPQLLNAIGERVIATEFDIKPLVRDICLSHVYQLSSTRTEENAWDERHFSHSKIRRLRAEVLLDCINQVTETSEVWPGLPEGSRAVHLPDGRTRNYFLTAFGRSDRATPCSCEVSTSPTLSQALHLLNGEVTSGKIAEGDAVAKMLEASGGDVMQVVDRIYMRCLCRRPTSEEQNKLAVELSKSANPVGTLQDIFWAVLNSNEFFFNH